ncbi:hypothetical protein [uncultured Acinetobacter sp.]|uniref:hypothetical protein n=1 Tax=uncultured Acinetobacter sp. TaxID=165433 RepID=UPI00258AD660|nr:hypothetical protein [uncultured Acinetobacter sp.]
MVDVRELDYFGLLSEINVIIDEFDKKINELEDDHSKEIINSLFYEKIKNIKNDLLPEIFKFIKENNSILYNQKFYNKSRREIQNIVNDLRPYLSQEPTISKVSTFLNILYKLNLIFNDLLISEISIERINNIIKNEFDPKFEQIQKQVEDVERAKLTLQNDALFKVFQAYERKLELQAKKWERKFYNTIKYGVPLTVSLSVIPLIFKDIEFLDLNFWFIKIITIAVTITLSTYFLRRSIHIRKQSDQMGQFSFEMDALPSFMSSLDKEKSDEVTLKLIDKYFGREIDQSQNDKIGDLMQSQLTTASELIRASAEMVKSVKSSDLQGK